jgi:hypothetical protein
MTFASGYMIYEFDGFSANCIFINFPGATAHGVRMLKDYDNDGIQDHVYVYDFNDLQKHTLVEYESFSGGKKGYDIIYSNESGGFVYPWNARDVVLSYIEACCFLPDGAGETNAYLNNEKSAALEINYPAQYPYYNSIDITLGVIMESDTEAIISSSYNNEGIRYFYLVKKNGKWLIDDIMHVLLSSNRQGHTDGSDLYGSVKADIDGDMLNESIFLYNDGYENKWFLEIQKPSNHHVFMLPDKDFDKYGISLYTNDVNFDGIADMILPDSKKAYMFSSGKLFELNLVDESWANTREDAFDLDNDGINETVSIKQSIGTFENRMIYSVIVNDGKTQKEYSLGIPAPRSQSVTPLSYKFIDYNNDGYKEILIDGTYLVSYNKAAQKGKVLSLSNEMASSLNTDNIKMKCSDSHLKVTDGKTSYDVFIPDMYKYILAEPDALRLDKTGEAYAKDFDNDGKSDLCVAYSLKAPYSRMGLLDGSYHYYYGDILKIEQYYYFENNSLAYKGMKTYPKYSNSGKQIYMSRGDIFSKFMKFLPDIREDISIPDEDGSGIEVNYVIDYVLSNLKITSPRYYLLPNLRVGSTKDDVIKSIGIPYAGYLEDSNWYYFSGGGPEYYTLALQFEGNRVSVIEITMDIVWD